MNDISLILLLCLVAICFLIAAPILCGKYNDKPLLWVSSLAIGEFVAWGLFFRMCFGGF